MDEAVGVVQIQPRAELEVGVANTARRFICRQLAVALPVGAERELCAEHEIALVASEARGERQTFSFLLCSANEAGFVRFHVRDQVALPLEHSGAAAEIAFEIFRAGMVADVVEAARSSMSSAVSVQRELRVEGALAFIAGETFSFLSRFSFDYRLVGAMHIPAVRFHVSDEIFIPLERPGDSPRFTNVAFKVFGKVSDLRRGVVCRSVTFAVSVERESRTERTFTLVAGKSFSLLASAFTSATFSNGIIFVIRFHVRH